MIIYRTIKYLRIDTNCDHRLYTSMCTSYSYCEVVEGLLICDTHPCMINKESVMSLTFAELVASS